MKMVRTKQVITDGFDKRELQGQQTSRLLRKSCPTTQNLYQQDMNFQR